MNDFHDSVILLFSFLFFSFLFSTHTFRVCSPSLSSSSSSSSAHASLSSRFRHGFLSVYFSVLGSTSELFEFTLSALRVGSFLDLLGFDYIYIYLI